jgi:hypothetical protein
MAAPSFRGLWLDVVYSRDISITQSDVTEMCHIIIIMWIPAAILDLFFINKQYGKSTTFHHRCAMFDDRRITWYAACCTLAYFIAYLSLLGSSFIIRLTLITAKAGAFFRE